MGTKTDVLSKLLEACWVVKGGKGWRQHHLSLAPYVQDVALLFVDSL